MLPWSDGATLASSCANNLERFPQMDICNCIDEEAGCLRCCPQHRFCFCCTCTLLTQEVTHKKSLLYQYQSMSVSLTTKQKKNTLDNFTSSFIYNTPEQKWQLQTNKHCTGCTGSADKLCEATSHKRAKQKSTPSGLLSSCNMTPQRVFISLLSCFWYLL